MAETILITRRDKNLHISIKKRGFAEKRSKNMLTELIFTTRFEKTFD